MAATSMALALFLFTCEVACAEDLQVARELVRDYLSAGEGERADLLARAEAMPYALLREAASKPLPRPQEGRRHTFQVNVPVAGAPPTEVLVVLPEAYDGEVELPVLVALHATGGQAQQMGSYWGAACDEADVILVCPEATLNKNAGYGSTDVERETVIAALAGFRKRFAHDPDRVGLTGMSMGGHATWDVGCRYPSEFALLLPVSGGPRQHVVPLVANLGDGPAIWQCLGGRDDPRMVRSVTMALKRLDRAEGDTTLDLDPAAGHTTFPASRTARLARLTTSRRADPPERIELLSYGPPGSRLHWVEVLEVDEDAYQPGDPLRLRFRSNPTEEEKLTKLWDEIEDEAASVRGTLRGNRVTLKTQGVQRLRLLLDSQTLDADTNLVVKVNRKKRHGDKPIPSAETLLEHLRRTGDHRGLVDITIELEP